MPLVSVVEVICLHLFKMWRRPREEEKEKSERSKEKKSRGYIQLAASWKDNLLDNRFFESTNSSFHIKDLLGTKQEKSPWYSQKAQKQSRAKRKKEGLRKTSLRKWRKKLFRWICENNINLKITWRNGHFCLGLFSTSKFLGVRKKSSSYSPTLNWLIVYTSQ